MGGWGYPLFIGAESNPKFFLSAGEASGDHYGAQIIAALRRRFPEATFSGLGGAEMEGAGQRRVVRAEDVAHMGITEVIRHAPYIFRQYRRLVDSIRRERPDAAVLIDFPDVNFRLAKHLRAAGVPVVWFVSPQLWAWKRRRIRWVQQRVDRMLVLFPFEETFYRARGVSAQFVGHPFVANREAVMSRELYAKSYDLVTSRDWIALLPGSRISEIRNNLPAMLEGVHQLNYKQDSNGVQCILPVANTVVGEDLEWLREQVEAAARRWNDPDAIRLVRDARAALTHSRAAVVASGTATVQALVVGTPFVVVYRVSDLTFALARRLVRYPAEIPAQVDEVGNLPIAMPNLIAGRRIVPELLNERFTGPSVAAALRALMEDGPARSRMIADLEETRERLEPPGGKDPIESIANAVEALVSGETRSSVPMNVSDV